MPDEARPRCPHCGTTNTVKSIFRTPPNEWLCDECADHFVPVPEQISFDAPPFDAPELSEDAN